MFGYRWEQRRDVAKVVRFLFALPGCAVLAFFRVGFGARAMGAKQLVVGVLLFGWLAYWVEPLDIQTATQARHTAERLLANCVPPTSALPTRRPFSFAAFRPGEGPRHPYRVAQSVIPKHIQEYPERARLEQHALTSLQPGSDAEHPEDLAPCEAIACGKLLEDRVTGSYCGSVCAYFHAVANGNPNPLEIKRSDSLPSALSGALTDTERLLQHAQASLSDRTQALQHQEDLGLCRDVVGCGAKPSTKPALQSYCRAVCAAAGLATGTAASSAAPAPPTQENEPPLYSQQCTEANLAAQRALLASPPDTTLYLHYLPAVFAVACLAQIVAARRRGADGSVDSRTQGVPILYAVTGGRLFWPSIIVLEPLLLGAAYWYFQHQAVRPGLAIFFGANAVYLFFQGVGDFRRQSREEVDLADARREAGGYDPQAVRRPTRASGGSFFGPKPGSGIAQLRAFAEKNRERLLAERESNASRASEAPPPAATSGRTHGPSSARRSDGPDMEPARKR